jgi:tetratricopeptide (TPR) repeat protein
VIDASFPDGGSGARYRMLETLRAFALDRLAAAGEHDAASGRLLIWARNLTRWIGVSAAGDDEPQADALLRRELANLRAAWRLARTGGHLDVAVAIVASLGEPSEWRDLPEIRGWAEELADDPALAAHPGAALVLATAARAAYMRGDPATAERRARAGLERATEDGARGRGLRALALAQLTRGEFAEVIDLELAAAPLGPGPNGGLGVAALAATYAGDLARARSFHAGMFADAMFPTLRAFTAYVGAEIDSAAGRLDAAERQYTQAIDLARSSGATFVVNIASVGLLTVLTRSGRTRDALRGYREVVDYFSSTGNWSHLWTTLRNLADLLRALDDPEPAALLDASTDHVPALRVAREAIRRHLAESPARRFPTNGTLGQ